MRADGTCVDDYSDAYAPHESSDTQYTRHVERFRRILGAAYGRAAGSCRAPRRRRIVAVAGAMLDASADVIGIEQTSAGWAKSSVVRWVSVITTRSSASLYESPIIAARDTDGIRVAPRASTPKRSDPDHRRGRNRHVLADVLRPLHDRVDVNDTRLAVRTPIDLPNATALRRDCHRRHQCARQHARIAAPRRIADVGVFVRS